MECQVFQIIQLFASENGGNKIIPHFPWEILTILTLYSSNCSLILPVHNPTATRKGENRHCLCLFFPVTATLQSGSEALSGGVVTRQAGRREHGRLAFQGDSWKEVISAEQSIYLKIRLLPCVYPIPGTPCCWVHEVKSVPAKVKIAQPALSLYPNPSRQLLNCCRSWNSQAEQGGSNLISHLHEKFRPPPVLRAPHQRSDATGARPGFTRVIWANLGRAGIWMKVKSAIQNTSDMLLFVCVITGTSKVSLLPVWLCK